ncbi:hypothetical protein GUITHDRAFT_122896, partial [Guillardia theta CCMP2712]
MGKDVQREILELERELLTLRVKNEVLLAHTSALAQISHPTADPPASAQQTTSWTIPDDISSDLKKLFQTPRDSKEYKTILNNLRMALGVDASALSPDKLSYDDYEVRVAREWELERKASSLGDLNILRVMAECIPGGSAASPLAGLQGMTESALSALWQTAIGRRLEEALRRPAEAGGRAGGDSPTSHNSKFAVNESDGTGSGEVREAVYGKIEEYYGGLMERIGLPQTELMKAIEEEHCKGKDAEEAFTTSNYNITTTAKEEWLNVTDPERRRRLSDGTRVIRGMEELKGLDTAIKAGLQEAELIALQLYT